MEQFMKPETLELIGQVLVMLAIAIVLYNWGISAMRRSDEKWARDNPPRFDVKPGNAADVLAGMDCLRTPLKDHKNPTPPADSMDELLAKHGVSAADRADMLRGTKL